MYKIYMILVAVFSVLLTIMCVYYYFTTKDMALLAYATVFTLSFWMFFKMFFNEYKAKEE